MSTNFSYHHLHRQLGVFQSSRSLETAAWQAQHSVRSDSLGRFWWQNHNLFFFLYFLFPFFSFSFFGLLSLQSWLWNDFKRFESSLSSSWSSFASSSFWKVHLYFATIFRVETSSLPDQTQNHFCVSLIHFSSFSAVSSVSFLLFLFIFALYLASGVSFFCFFLVYFCLLLPFDKFKMLF